MPRPRVSWMTLADDRILETLHESGLVLSPRILAVNTDYTRQYVSERLAQLLNAGLVRKQDSGLYEITDKGCKYLNSQIKSEELE